MQRALQLAAAEEEAQQDEQARQVRREEQLKREAKQYRQFKTFQRQTAKEKGYLAETRTQTGLTPADVAQQAAETSDLLRSGSADSEQSAKHMAWMASLRHRALSPPLIPPKLISPKQVKLHTEALFSAPRVKYEYGYTGFPLKRQVELQPLAPPAALAEEPEPEPEEELPAQPKPVPVKAMLTQEKQPAEQPVGALANMHAEMQELRRSALANKDKPNCLHTGPVRDRHGMILSFDEVADEIAENKKAFEGMQSACTRTMSVRLQADHTGILEEMDLKERVDVRQLMKLCGLPADHIRKMCDIFDREVPKSRAKAKGGATPQLMSKVQFQRFMQKNGYQDKAIVSRLFEVFDSKRDNALSFEELLCGLAFFEERPGNSETFLPGKMSAEEAEEAESDDTFLDICSRFFDLDGKQLISKLNIFKVLCTIIKKEVARQISDAIFGLLSLDKSLLTYSEFIEGACRHPELCTIFYKVMLLQGKAKGSKSFNSGRDQLLELTADWYEAQAAGRLVGMENCVVHAFHEADYLGEVELLRQARHIRKARKEGVETESLHYYVSVMENIVEKGWGFVEQEAKRLNSGIQSAQQELQALQGEDDSPALNKVRLLTVWQNILNVFTPQYVKPLQPGQTLGVGSG